MSEETTTLSVNTKVIVPSVPNFLRTANGTLPLSAFTIEALEEIGAAWTKALIARAWKQTQDPKLAPEPRS